MATLEALTKLSLQERRSRFFSEDFKKKKVGEIEKNLVTVQQISREYQVSRAAVYKWVYRYSVMRKKSVKMVIESQSDTHKIETLKKKVAELERLIGQKQILIDFQAKMIELAEQEYNINIKKKYSSKPSSGTGKTG